MCDNRVGENVAHFLVGCGEFDQDRLVLLNDVQNCGGQRVVG